MQKGGFLRMVFGTLGTSVLESLLAGKGVIPANEGLERKKEQGRTGFFVPTHPLTNFEI